MYNLIITDSAQKDLEAIIEYIAIELSNPAAAEALLGEVEKCYDALILQPYMYELCRNDRLRVVGYRRAVIKRYIMIYSVDESKETVFIMRFFYGARDYDKLI